MVCQYALEVSGWFLCCADCIVFCLRLKMASTTESTIGELLKDGGGFAEKMALTEN